MIDTKRNHLIGQVMREMREDAGTTVSAVADKLGVSRSLISQYERGERTLTVERFVQLCDVYEVPPRHALDVIGLRTRRPVAVA